MVADGHLEDIPTDYDILLAGCACVDFSSLNTSKPDESAVLSKITEKYGKDVLTGKVEDTEPRGRDEEFIQLLGELAITECGTSYKTFLATLRLLATHRPKVLLMENVVGAPWSAMTNFWLRKIGFTAQHVIVDTKNFYIPQTRTRGYLVAVDHEAYGDLSPEIAEYWASVMNSFHNTYSATADKFLLPPDDPRIVKARRDEEVRQGKSKESDWEYSRDRHDEVRRNEGLPADNSYTGAEFIGPRVARVQPHQRSSHAYIRGQTARVLDLMDINHQIGNKEEVDPGYKLLVGDMSQNADFTERWCYLLPGLISCITPDAMPFRSDEHRLVFGVEVLHLQGLPIDKFIVPPGIKNHQIQDVAGNTMTTTVIAVAMMAALIAIHRAKPNPSASLTIIPDKNPPPQMRLPVPSREVVEYRNEMTRADGKWALDLVQIPEYNTSGCIATSVADATERLLRGRRYCFCTDYVRPVNQESRILICETCGETACKDCYGNPAHQFVPFTALADRECKLLAAEEIRKWVQIVFPGRFVLGTICNLSGKELCKATGSPESSLPVFEAIVTALSEDVYYIHKVRITENITVEYKTKNTYARAVISPAGVTWYIFLSREFRIWENIAEHHDLADPIARLVLDKNSPIIVPFGGDNFNWQIWAVHCREVRVHLAPLASDEGLEVVKVESSDPNVDAATISQKLAGPYVRKPGCGSAEKSLHIHPNGFLFKEVTKLGPAQADHFVFADTCRQLDLHEVREALLHMDSGFKPHLFPVKQPCFALGYMRGHWVSAQGLVEFGPLEASKADQLHVGRNGEFATACCDFEHQGRGVFLDIRTPLLHLPVRDTAMALWEASRIRMSAQDKGNGPGDLFYSIPVTEHRSFLREFAFALPALASYLNSLDHLGKTQSLPFSGLCYNCGHRPPQSHLLEHDQWEKKLVVEKAKKKGAVPGDGNPPPTRVPNVTTTFKLRHKVSVTERPSDVKAFEKAARKRQPPVEIAVRLDLAPQSPAETVVSLALDDHHPETTVVAGKHEAIAGLRISLHPIGLAQRAAAAIAYSRAPRELDVYRMSLSYEINVDYRPDIQLHLPLFATLLRPTDQDTDLPAVKTPGFDQNNMSLTDVQVPAVAWMIQQENNPKPFREREIDEFIIPELHCRMTGTATHDVVCRGGVVAHDVGFGKTVCVLALVDHQREHDKAVYEHHSRNEPERIAVNATLIVSPRSIARQWKSEIYKFLGRHIRVLLIENYKQMTALTVAQFRTADYIVVATEVLDPSKGERGAKYSDTLSRMLGRKRWPKSLDDPVMDTHYRRGVDNLPDVVKALLEDLANRNSSTLPLTRATLDSLVQADEKLEREILAEAHIMDIEEGARQLGVTQSEIDKAHQRITKQPVLKPTNAIIFDMFAYNRVIWDEYSYASPAVCLFVKHCITGSKFLLSGTPPLRNVQDVCHTADILGVHLARAQPNAPAGLPAVAYGPSNASASDAEKLALLAEELSPASYAEIHRQAANFISLFYRSNTVPSDKFPHSKVIIPVELPMAVALPYEDMSHTLARAGMNVFAVSAELRSTFEREVDFKTDPQNLAAAALIMRASGSVGHLYNSQNQASLDSQGLAGILKASATTALGRAARDLKLSFDRFMFVWLVIENDWNWFLNHGGDQSKYPNRMETYKNFIRHLREPGLPGVSQAAVQFGGSAIWRRIATALTLCDPDDASVFEAVRWCAQGWFGIRERGFAIFSPLDVFDMNLTVHMDSETGQMATDLRESVLRTLVTEAQLVKLRKKTPGSINFLEPQPRSEIYDVDKFDVVETRLRTWEEERLVRILGAVAPLTAPPEGGSLRRFLGTKASSRSDTGFLKAQCEFQGIKFRGTDDSEALIRLLVDSARRVLSENSYISGRQRCARHEVFPQMGRVQVRGAQVIAMFETLQRSFHVVRNMATNMIEAAKRERFLGLVCRLNASDVDDPDFANCESCPGTNPPSLADSLILQACGHLVCKGCVERRMKQNSKQCPVGDCHTPFYPEALIRADRLVDWDNEKSARALKTGIKVQVLLDLVKIIQQFGPTDRAVVFVQYDKLMYQVRRALADNHISSLGGNEAVGIADDIENFKAGAARVLLLELNTAQAAGSNLTIANHVIFVTPLVENDDYSFASIMRQAMGRCIRTGQEKEVFVHHLCCTDTLDETIIRSKLGDLPMYNSTAEALDIIGDDVNNHNSAAPGDPDDAERLRVADDATQPLPDDAGKLIYISSFIFTPPLPFTTTCCTILPRADWS